MAQQMITLEEAAEKLGISPEEMKKRLKTDPDFRRLSQIRDGATVRFKLSAIEELARQLGMASDPGLPLAPMSEDAPPGSDDFKVPTLDKKAKKDEEKPLQFDSGSSEEEVFSLSEDPSSSAGPTPKSSGKLTPNKPAKDKAKLSDSSAGSTDSDVRLDGGKGKKKDEAAVPTEEIALDFSGSSNSAVIKGGSSAKLSAPKPGGSSGKLASDKNKGAVKGAAQPPADSSEFELSLDADSDDFELQNKPDAGDEVDLGSMPREKTGSASSGRASKSGINLRDPADSGISLEKGKGKDSDKGKAEKEAKDTKKKAGESSADSDADFELSLDSSAASSGSKLGAPKSGKLVLDPDSDSEFELTLDDSSASSLEQAALGAAIEEQDKGDIFETDFEIPPMPDESGSEAVALESDTDLEKSDFELAMDDSDVAAEEPSQSEVVLLEDEEPAAKGKKAKPAPKSKVKKLAEKTDEGDVDLADVESADEDDASASKALKGVKGKKRGTDEDEEDEEAPAATVVERPTKPWGILPVIFLAPAFIFVLLGALMGYEMLQTMWGYQQPRKPTAPLIRGLASNFDMELRDQ